MDCFMIYCGGQKLEGITKCPDAMITYLNENQLKFVQCHRVHGR